MKDPEEKLRAQFLLRGALTSVELREALQVSQPTLSRLLSRSERNIIRLGRGRSIHYAMARAVGGGGSSWPLYSVDPLGKAHHVGALYALQNRQWCLLQDEPWDALRGDDFPLGLYPDLPWFLDDLRPQGFLGRIFAQTHGRTLGLPSDPRLWSADDVVMALVRFGHDLQGSFVIGEEMLTIVQDCVMNPPEAMSARNRGATFRRLAEETLKGGWPGSSAAGEQPKFVTRIREKGGTVRHVIVKFSGQGDRPADQRWRDLLAAEHIAGQVLSANGIPAAETSLVESGGRVFLESTRFDRAGEHGRRGLVSLAAVDAAFFGELHTSWVAAAQRLKSAQWITVAAAERLAELWWFGSLIANTDMHYGNASLFLDKSPPLSLAPAYDMLPMLYRPDLEGRLPELRFDPPPPLPESLPAWSTAVNLAELYWERVSQDETISGQFRKIADLNGRIIAKYRRYFA